MVTLVLLITYLGLGALFIGLAVPLIQGRVPPNPWYGVRVPKTLRDPETWYAVNAYFGRRFAVAGLLVAVAGVLLWPFGFIPHIGAALYVAAGHGILVFSIVWITIDTFRYLRKF